MAEAQLELRFLGDLAVIREGEVLPLPPSRKTRALLAYLAMNPRPFRRETLCELLWEIPDDPRGSLRWSLSKIRGLVNTRDHVRIVADRTFVRFDDSHAGIDVRNLYALAEGNLQETPIEALKTAAEAYQGLFLEGLELTNFYTFYAWCVAERERVTRARTRILEALVQRLQDTPEQALEYARALVINSPYEEAAQAKLIRLLVESNRPDEAQQQYQLGKRMLAEVGAETSGALFRALRGAPGSSGGRAAAKPVAPRPEQHSDLVGREDEMGRLTALYTRVKEQRNARFALVSGAPGIGKSRVLDALAALGEEDNAKVMRASAVESGRLRPFALWLEALAGTVGDRWGKPFTDPDNREQLLADLAELVARETASGPVILVLDDFQWCDESSAAALDHVARANLDQPLLVVIAGRESELSDNTATQRTFRSLRAAGLMEEIRLGPLSQEAVLQIIDDQAPAAECQRLSRECGGNPLMAIELARACAAGEGTGSLAQLIRERLSRFDLQAVDLLRWAAVLGGRIHIATLADIADMTQETVGDVLDQAVQEALLVPVDYGFRFSHDLVARCIYNDISPTRQRVMHGRVARLLEKDTALDLAQAAALAHHACLSGEAPLAARGLVSAGRLCLRFFANREAVSLARKGLRLAQQLNDGERVCLTLELEEILLTAMPLEDWESAARQYTDLAEQALDHGAIHHARLGYYMASYVRWYQGHWHSAREDSLQAERVARGGSEEDRIQGMAEAARCLAMLEQDLPRADAMLMEARALARRRGISIEAIPAAGGMLRYHENRLDEAEELFKEARTLAKGTGNHIGEFQANEYLVMIDFGRGRYRAALARCGELMELGEKLREGSEAPFARAMEGLCRYALEDDSQALDAALDDLRNADAKHRLACVLSRAALLDNERGHYRAARTRAEEALACAEALDRATEIMLAHIALAQANRHERDELSYRHSLAGIAALEGAAVAAWARERARQLVEG
jgi:DNA-binding SARP family transcriptional activator